MQQLPFLSFLSLSAAASLSLSRRALSLALSKQHYSTSSAIPPSKIPAVVLGDEVFEF